MHFKRFISKKGRSWHKNDILKVVLELLLLKVHNSWVYKHIIVQLFLLSTQNAWIVHLLSFDILILVVIYLSKTTVFILIYPEWHFFHTLGKKITLVDLLVSLRCFSYSSLWQELCLWPPWVTYLGLFRRGGGVVKDLAHLLQRFLKRQDLNLIKKAI